MQTIHPFRGLRALSSVYGRIETLLVVSPPSQAEKTPEAVEKRFRKLVQDFGSRTSFVILSDLVGGETGSSIQHPCSPLRVFGKQGGHLSGMDPKRITLLHCFSQVMEQENGHRREWARDAFLMGEWNGNPVIIEPFLAQKAGERNLAEQVGSYSAIPIQPTNLLIEGGNVLVGSDYALVGKDLLVRNIEQYLGGLGKDAKGNPDWYSEMSQKHVYQTTQAFKELLGVNHLIWVGSEYPKPIPFLGSQQGKEQYQPFFHIDLFLTLGGLQENGKELVFVANFTLPRRGTDGTYTDSPHLAGHWREHYASLEALDAFLNDIREQLKDAENLLPGPEFEVVDLPIGIEVDANGELTLYSFNNCLVEWYYPVRKITFPEYNHTQQWKDLLSKIKQDLSRQFTVIRTVDFNFSDTAASHGSLHCLTQVLKRSDR